MIEFKAPRSIWELECRDPDGSLVWVENYENLVTDVGLSDLLQQYFKGQGYNAQWYVGLIASPAILSPFDTAAVHGGWTESIAYNAGARPSLTLGAVGNKMVSNAANKAAFIMNANADIMGTFLISNPVKSGALGILYSEAPFASGVKAVLSGQTLTAAVTIAAA